MGEPTIPSNPISIGGTTFEKWLSDMGQPLGTGHDWVKRGMVSPVNILGQLYIPGDEAERFWKRASTGEFANETEPAAPAHCGRQAASVSRNQTTVTIKAAVTALLKAKRASNKSPRYVKSLDGYLNQFMRGREDVRVANIGVETLEEWFSGRKEMPATHATGVNRLNALFSFCVRRGWCSENPCARLERVTIDHRPPRFFTPAEADKAIEICPPRSIPWLVLGMFCGLRPEAEVEQLPREHIDLENRRVKVTCEDAGGGKRRGTWRFVPIPKRAAALLKQHLDDKVCPSHSTLRRDRRKLRDLVGGEWPADILRHTAASYWLALTGDVGKCATVFGNSPKVFASHYNGLATPEDARKFFGLPPLPKSRSRDILFDV
jgi:integrase